MTAQDYRQAGFYEISLQLDAAFISRAEDDIMQAYIQPIVPDVDINSDMEARNALMNLTVLLIMQRSAFATRSGAKEKMTPQSDTASRWDILSQQAATCAMKLSKLADKYNIKVPEDKVIDICGIYFSTHYLNV